MEKSFVKWPPRSAVYNPYIDGFVQERRNSIANALELPLSCTKPSIFASSPSHIFKVTVPTITVWVRLVTKNPFELRSRLWKITKDYLSAKNLPMMTSWLGNNFCITGLLWRKPVCQCWIPLTKGQQCRALMFSLLLLTQTNCWTNIQVAAILSSQSKGFSVIEWVIKFNSLSGDSRKRGPYSPYRPCNHSLYIGIIIFTHIENPQSRAFQGSFEN